MKKPKDKFIFIDNIKTRYWDIGKSEIPIILVHGIIASVEYWEKNIFELSKNNRVIALDLIGFGKTDKPNIDYKIDDFVLFLKSFLNKLNIKQCFLIGHSFGGSICIKFSLDFPQMVKKLILVSSVGFSRKLPLGMRILSLPGLNKLIYLANKTIFVYAIRKHVYDKKILTDEFFERTFKFNQSYKARRTLSNIITQNIDLTGIKKIVFEPIKKRIDELSLSILIIWGKQDKLLPLKDVKFIDGAKAEIFDKCCHIPQMEHANKFNELVQNFLNN